MGYIYSGLYPENTVEDTEEPDIPMTYNRHYIIIDTDDLIMDGWSDGPHPERDISRAICINKEGEYQFRLWPNGEENPPLDTLDGLPLYRWNGERVIARTEEEIAAHRATTPDPVPQPSLSTLTRVLKAMAPSLPMSIAVDVPELFSEWKAGVSYLAGDLASRMVGHKPTLFKCINGHASQEDWAPENTPSLWMHIVKEGTGTREDPYIISSNLAREYINGKYYLYNGVLYLCTRDSGIPLVYTPDQLLGQYFEEAG